MAEDEPAETTSAAARPTPGEVAALMEAAIVAARVEGIAVPPDLARKTFAMPFTWAAMAVPGGWQSDVARPLPTLIG